MARYEFSGSNRGAGQGSDLLEEVLSRLADALDASYLLQRPVPEYLVVTYSNSCLVLSTAINLRDQGRAQLTSFCL